MKIFWKAIIVAVVALVGVGQANAQFRFGIKAGVNVNKFHFSDLKENLNEDNGCGFTGGVMTEFTVPLVGLCFDASLMYTHMGANMGIFKMNDTSALPSENDEQVKVKKDFLEIPINVKYKFPIPMVRPYLFTGPSFAFKLSGDDNWVKTKSFQCAWNIGAGVEVLNHVQIAASYGFGINNVWDKLNLGGQTVDGIKLKNNYWTITAAYLF